MSQAIDPPRGLVIAAGLWILLALFLALGTTLPLQVTPASLAPAVRVTIVTCLVGGLIAWPLVRLSQVTAVPGVLRPLIDAATLACLLQLVIWPLRLATPWTIERTVLIDLCALSSLVAVAGVVAAGCCWSRSSVRAVAMVLCLVIAGGIRWPLAAAGVDDFALTSPFIGACATILELTDATASMPDSAVWNHARIAAAFSSAIGGVGFFSAALLGAARGRRPRGGVATPRRVI
ncbi:MAG: hypothetical protein EXS17_05905 [Phycisphaerales bacterium]|nr:hypothetical protein [Phycisphaerales bacterium]